MTDRAQSRFFDELYASPDARVGRAWGKVMLFGEYAVLDGESALLSATQHQARALYQSHSDVLKYHYHTSVPWGQINELCEQITAEGRVVSHIINAGPLGQMVMGVRRDIDVEVESIPGVSQQTYVGVNLPFAAAVLTRLKAPFGVYHIDTTHFGVLRGHRWEKMGVGSSGASTAALIDLLAHLPCQSDFDLSTPQQRFELACDVHHKVQGRLGSGADIATSTYGGLIRFAGPPLRQVTRLNTCIPDTWGIWSGGSTSTVKAVKQVKAWAHQKPHAYSQCMGQLCDAEQFAITVLSSTHSQRDWCAVLRKGAEAARILGERAGIPIWTQRHQRWSSLIEPFGGVIKPSGAGGDDLSLFAAEDPEAQRRCLDVLMQDAQSHGDMLRCFKIG